MKTFQKICKMNQPALKKYLTARLMQTHKQVVDHDGYLYAQGTFPVLLVAHLDTVHQALPSIIQYNASKQSLTSPQGIGGDDRCGVFMILEIIKQYNCSVLFCEDEEKGCIGASKFVDSDLARTLEFNYIIEFDRKGSKDAVFYDCDNPEFEEFITKEFYETAIGLCSDISILAPYLGCAAVNLSCGYYEPHTLKEYVVIPEMYNSIHAACNILARTKETDKFEYIEAKHYSRYNYKWYEDYYDESPLLVYIIEYDDEWDKTQWDEVYASSEEAAVGEFCMRHPHIPFANVRDIYEDNSILY